jgi:hypothetical protein
VLAWSVTAVGFALFARRTGEDRLEIAAAADLGLALT